MVVFRRHRFSPFREFEDMRRRMDRCFDRGFVRSIERRWSERGCLPVDVYSTPGAFVVRANVPGVDPEGVNVTIEGRTLTIKVNLPDLEQDVDYSLRERELGEYERTLSFNVPIQPEAVEATFENGVLTLTVPKAEEVKAKKIEIKTG